MTAAACRSLARIPGLSSQRRRAIHGVPDSRSFVPGDIVVLRQKLDRAAPPLLTRPLRVGGQIHNHKGVVLHDDIIGKRVRDVVQTAPSNSGKPGTEYRLHEVKLEEYVRLSRRLVTPIYPADARVIVELFDLHVEPFNANAAREDGERLEILEAGTGHGALTLYLSRAIHASNPPPPLASSIQEDSGAQEAAMVEWKSNRRAVVHTVDSSAKFSAHAENVVKGFKRGMYRPNVDFYVTDVGAWTRQALAERGDRPFLSHAFLDLPGAQTHLPVIAQALRTDGCLVVFNPSITQILDCLQKTKEDGLLLELENVFELGVNGSSGGREWNVKVVRPKAKMSGIVEEAGQDEDDATVMKEESITEANDSSAETETEDVQQANPEGGWATVCRPKVGDRIVGGGFLGVWRKQRDMRAST